MDQARQRREGRQTQSILGANVRALRARLRISQEELSFRANLHRTYVGAIERGERNVSLQNIVKLARALRVKPERLLRGIG